jgi:hypothetical protein
VLWDEIFFEIQKQYPDVQTNRVLVDAMTTVMVLKPGSLDTIVASNLHADILSDLAAALSGSLGIAPTANLNPERKFPSMFEPIHGSAFDITGKGIRRDDARAPRRAEGRSAADEGDRADHRGAGADARPGRRARYARGDQRSQAGPLGE